MVIGGSCRTSKTILHLFHYLGRNAKCSGCRLKSTYLNGSFVEFGVILDVGQPFIVKLEAIFLISVLVRFSRLKLEAPLTTFVVVLFLFLSVLEKFLNGYVRIVFCFFVQHTDVRYYQNYCLPISLLPNLHKMYLMWTHSFKTDDFFPSIIVRNSG